MYAAGAESGEIVVFTRNRSRARWRCWVAGLWGLGRGLRSGVGVSDRECHVVGWGFVGSQNSVGTASQRFLYPF